MIVSGGKEKLGCAIVSTGHFLTNNYDFCLEVCQKFWCHDDRDIRGNVLSALAPISKRYRKIDGDLAKLSLQDTDKDMRSYAKIIRRDIERFAKFYRFPIWQSFDWVLKSLQKYDILN